MAQISATQKSTEGEEPADLLLYLAVAAGALTLLWLLRRKRGHAGKAG